MPVNAAAALQNVTLLGQSKTAVVVGGTTGIGGGVARLLAKMGCARVFVMGRDAEQGRAALEVIRGLAPKGGKIELEFVRGDLSDLQGMRAAARAIQRTVGDPGIDYLVMCQNGTPTAHNMKDNADGHDTAFAIQALSRVALAYFLTTSGGLAPNAIVLSICNQGQSLDDLDVEDLSLKRRLATDSATTLFMNQSKRDSTVLDSCFEEFNARYPQYRYYSLIPGFIKYAMWIGIRLIGTTPDEYANFPVYILASPDAPRTLGTAKFFNRSLTPMPLGKWSRDPKNREKMWGKMMQIIGELEGNRRWRWRAEVVELEFSRTRTGGEESMKEEG
ncbi:hypothetical protein DFH06DRAFT_1145658 [Mycena polygramma]|nr:hypothetical protein DFH06DRAFT_1145658 [Mycena polygramma]